MKVVPFCKEAVSQDANKALLADFRVRLRCFHHLPADFRASHLKIRALGSHLLSRQNQLLLKISPHDAQQVQPLNSAPPLAQPRCTRRHGRGAGRSTTQLLRIQLGTCSLTRSFKVRVEVCHEEEVEDKQQKARKRYQVWGQPGREDLWESSKRTQELIKTCNKVHVLLPATAQTWLKLSGC